MFKTRVMMFSARFLMFFRIVFCQLENVSEVFYFEQRNRTMHEQVHAKCMKEDMKEEIEEEMDEEIENEMEEIETNCVEEVL